MKNIKTFENYEYENFTYSDMEFAKELYEEGMTDPKDIAREMDWKDDMDEATVKQMIYTMKKSGEIT
jgi:hypothetical protein